MMLPQYLELEASAADDGSRVCTEVENGESHDSVNDKTLSY